MQSTADELTELRELIVSLTAQVNQYKSVCESQQAALTEKNALLEQYQKLNENLKEEIEGLKKSQSSGAQASGSVVGFSSNPWEDGSSGKEPEQFRMLFIGNLSYETNDESLREHFAKFGEVEKANVKIDAAKNRSRGFGFVVYKTCAMVDNAQNNRPHIVDSRKVDTKRALPKEDGANSENILRTTDLFVGGLSRETTEEDVRAYFGKYGNLTLFKMPTFPDSGKSKGYAFLSFEDYDIVDKLVLIKHHTVGCFRVEVKKRLPTAIHQGMKDKKDAPWGNKNRQEDHSTGYSSGGYGLPDNKRPRNDYGGNQYNNRQLAPVPSMSQPPPSMAKPNLPPQANSPPQNPMDLVNMGNVDSAQAQALAAYFSTLAQANKNSNQGSQGNMTGSQGNMGNSQQPATSSYSQPSGNNSYNQAPANTSYNQGYNQGYN